MHMQDDKKAANEEPRGNDAANADGSNSGEVAGEPQTVSRRSALKTGLASAAGILTVSPALTSDGQAAGIFGRLRDFAQGRSQARSRRRSSTTAIKQAAMSDYRQSLSSYGGRLANPIEQLAVPKPRNVPWDIDIAIIGSGYGGSICAARLAQQMQPGTRLCLFERGKEWIPGTFPDTFRGVIRENRLAVMRGRHNTLKNPGGLFNFHKGEDVDVIVGSGFGGTSLLNAGVAIKPDLEVFQRKGWPAALRHREVLDPFYDAVAKELSVTPTGYNSSPKMMAQRMAASRMAVPDRQFFAANLAVTLHPRMNQQGMLQRGCTFCGDCISGCNTGAKNTLQMNYLPLAKHHGAELYERVECRHIEKRGNHYRLHMIYHKGSGRNAQAIPFARTARMVIVSAGSLGSTGIMMRSRERGLQLSGQVGYRWSGNGDTLGFVTKTDQQVNSAGFGAYESGGGLVGPSIQSVIRMYGKAHPAGRILIQDGSMPRAYANVVGTLMRDMDLSNTMVMFGMGHDGSKGRVVLTNGEPIVDWPGAKETSYRKRMRKHFELMADAHGGRYKYLRAFGANLITVHPLGGCNMSDDPAYGVVNHVGQVFSGYRGGQSQSQGADRGQAMVHSGLYIADGSIVPGSLGANPYMTIGALSERIAASIALAPMYRDLFVQRS